MTRATQLRARFVQRGGRLRVVWWVSDPGRVLSELIDDVTDEVRDVLVDEHVQESGPERWHIADEDGSTWLVLDVPVRPWVDPRRDLTRRATTPR
jgi:hypothetical protein